MQRTPALALTLAIWSLLGLACGSDDASTVVTAPPTTAPPTTAPPTTAPPTTAPPGTAPDLGLPERPVVVDDGAFPTIAELGGRAVHVVVGTVRDEVSLGRPGLASDPLADELLGLTIEVEHVLAGDALDEVQLAWDAYAVDAAGERVATNVLNGVRVPRPGDRVVLFLQPADAAFADWAGGFPTHAPVALDGVGIFDGDTVAVSDDTAEQAAHLTGMTVEEIAAAL